MRPMMPHAKAAKAVTERGARNLFRFGPDLTRGMRSDWRWRLKALKRNKFRAPENHRGPRRFQG